MPQARGSQFKLNAYEEDTYGTDPAVPAAKRIRTTGCSVVATQALEPDPTLAEERMRGEPGKTNKDVAGDIPQTLAAEDIGILLKHAFGVVATGKSITKQPTNVTGVEIWQAESSCPTGDGTLDYLNAGTTLSWKANGDTVGAAIDVSAGGDFTLESGTPGAYVVITVTAGDLPGADQSDIDIGVSVAGYTHIFTPGDLPVGLTLEKDFGANIAGVGRYERFNGCRVGSMAMAFPQSGYPTVTFSMKGAAQTLASTPLDAIADDYGHTSFTSFAVASIKEGGAVIANVTEVSSITLENELDENGFVIGSGTRVQLTEGFASASGSLSAMFDSPALMNKAINDTESSLDINLVRGTGEGSAGNEAVRVIVDPMKYELSSPPIDGPAGVLIAPNFKAYKAATGTKRGLKMIIKNAVSVI